MLCFPSQCDIVCMCIPWYNAILLVLCTSCSSETKWAVCQTRPRNGRKTLPHCQRHKKTKFCRETTVCIKDYAISMNSIIFQKYNIMNKVKNTSDTLLPPKSLRINQYVYIKLFWNFNKSTQDIARHMNASRELCKLHEFSTLLFKNSNISIITQLFITYSNFVTVYLINFEILLIWTLKLFKK